MNPNSVVYNYKSEQVGLLFSDIDPTGIHGHRSGVMDPEKHVIPGFPAAAAGLSACNEWLPTLNPRLSAPQRGCMALNRGFPWGFSRKFTVSSSWQPRCPTKPDMILYYVSPTPLGGGF